MAIHRSCCSAGVYLWLIGFTILLDVISDASAANFNDPEWPNQWYLKLMNIENAWKMGYTGKDVLVGVVDSSGMDWTNKEFQGKYISSYSYDFNNKDTDPKPASSESPHGTQVAGIAVAKANNGFCGVGVAYDAKVAGYKFQYNLPDASLAQIVNFSPALDNVQIYACAWGPGGQNNGYVEYLSSKEAQAMENLATKGRNNKGSVIVFASGNGGQFLNHCGYDGYVNSIYTMGITMVNRDNSISKSSVECTAIMATAYTRDKQSYGENKNPMAAPGDSAVNGGCSTSFSLSSAASAVASGIFALVLQARPNLSWREVQHIVAIGSDPCPLQNSTNNWKLNGAGLLVSDRFGFGLLDATSMIRYAIAMSPMPQQVKCERSFLNKNSEIPGKFVVDLQSWPSECGGESNRIKFLEHVVLTLNLTFNKRGNLQVYLTSPQKTRSIIVRKRLPDFRATTLVNYPALSLHYWGENPKGNWDVTFNNTDAGNIRKGVLYNWKLTLYGTTTDPWKAARKYNCTAAPGSTPTAAITTSLKTTSGTEPSLLSSTLGSTPSATITTSSKNTSGTESSLLSSTLVSTPSAAITTSSKNTSSTPGPTPSTATVKTAILIPICLITTLFGLFI